MSEELRKLAEELRDYQECASFSGQTVISVLTIERWLDALTKQEAAPPRPGYHSGAKDAFRRVVNEWPVRKEKVQTWANNCAVLEQQAAALASVPQPCSECGFIEQHLTSCSHKDVPQPPPAPDAKCTCTSSIVEEFCPMSDEWHRKNRRTKW